MEHDNALLGMALASILLLLLTGTLVFHFIEHWTYVDSFYFTGITMATVGYGDITPHTNIGKIITVFFSLTSVGVVLYSLSILARHAFRQRIEDVNWIVQRNVRKDDKVVVQIKPKN